LHKGGTETAGETDDEAEEPKDVYVNGITFGCERVKGLRGQAISIRDAHEFLRELLKKLRGHIG